MSTTVVQKIFFSKEICKYLENKTGLHPRTLVELVDRQIL
jgi:hypothetical protein